MRILGIESSCDETAAAIVRADGLVLSDIKATQIDIFKNLGGVVPEMAARAHTEKILPVIDEALKAAAVDWAQIDQIHVTEGPGLIGSLLVGHSAAQALAMAYNKPLHWVNHLRAHCLACWLWEAGETKPEIVFPSIGLLVSGGHTQL